MEMSITPNRRRTPDRGRQRGQSSVFVIVFLSITILSLVFLYKAGMLTSKKMELQNAADGVAYSVAILEARDLNFMAYTNRAMVANEVAIGQAVGLASWPRHWESIAYYEYALCGGRLEPIGQIMVLLSWVPAAGSALVKMGQEILEQCVKIRDESKDIFEDPGSGLASDVDSEIAIPLAQLMQQANQGLSDAQSIFHMGTLAYVVETINQVTEDNVSDNTAGDTTLSPYGLAALLGHLYSFGHFAPYIDSYGSDPNRKDNPYIRTHVTDSTDIADTIAFERFAAITSASRDEFGKGPRRWRINPVFSDPQTFAIGPIYAVVVLLKFTMTFEKGLGTDIYHRAGSELRYVNTGQGEEYNWSSADTSSGGINYTFKVGVAIEWSLPPPLPESWSTFAALDGEIIIGTNGLKFAIDFVLPIIGTVSLPPIEINLPIPNLPFGAGATQINASTMNKILSGDLAGIPDSDLYGHAPAGSSIESENLDAHRYAWDASGASGTGFTAVGSGFSCDDSGSVIPQLNCNVPVVSEYMPEQQVNGGNLYSGLKQYSDTTDAEDLWGFEGPQIIIALEKQITGIPGTTDTSGIYSGTAPQFTGRFELIESSETDNVIGAIAKGEVYFKRPSDMDLFRRWDTVKTSSGNSSTLYEEYGSAFNPYWQARLAPLSHADRAVATAQQHGQDLETGSTATQTITASWELDTWIN